MNSPTKTEIGPKMGGEFTYQNGIPYDPIDFDHHSHWPSRGLQAKEAKGLEPQSTGHRSGEEVPP